jgi:hypothetical protein
MEHLDTLLEADKVVFTHFFTVDSFLLLFLSLKQPYSFLLFGFFGYALDTINGKSKNFNKLMNDKLQEIKTDLAVNGKQTRQLNFCLNQA